MTADSIDTAGTENEAEKSPGPPDTTTTMIYVDYSAPATLRYSETAVTYLTLREAITAWQALPHESKRNASIATDENAGGATKAGNLSTLGTLGYLVTSTSAADAPMEWPALSCRM